MGPVRSAVMWQAVVDATEISQGDRVGGEGLTILDLGGGTGGDAVRLAGLGHRVTVVDPSPDALAALRRRAAEAGLADDAVTGVLGDTADLGDHVEPRSVDLVICHGVLEHVDDPATALASLASVLRPGGHASIVVAGRHAAILARALAGDFATAASLFGATAAEWDVRVHGPRRFVPDEIATLLAAHDLTPVATQALRVFSDLVPSALVDLEPGARASLYELERLVRDDPAFSAISVGLQTIARLDLNQ